MKKIIDTLCAHPQISDYKINLHHRESCELFFVKGKLETVRRTDTCDKLVTVYADHDEYKGDAQFYVYPSTTDEQLVNLAADAVKNALLINNKNYTLPEAEQGEYEVASNFSDYAPIQLAKQIAIAVFEANTVPHAAINSLEVFVTKHEEEIINSRGLHKRQTKYDAMVEAIPTYNGEGQSVELYEQYSFARFDAEELKEEIAGKMAEVKARYEAVAPETVIDCPVILGRLELARLFHEIASDLSCGAVYSHSNLHKKGDVIQAAPSGDMIGITMCGEIPGCVSSSRFDSDGLSLNSLRVVDQGKVVNYHGSNRYSQYLGETPSGVFPCLCANTGSLGEEVFADGPWLEVVSMSGLQVDFYSDYIGGEVRLAYYNNGSIVRPLTGISIAGKLSKVLDSIRFSSEETITNDYRGPKKALLKGMKIF